MLKKLMAIPLALFLSLTTLQRVAFAKVQRSAAQHEARIKTEITRRGSGKNSRVIVRLHSGREVRGRIAQSTDNGFTLIDQNSGKSSGIAYHEVRSVRGLDLGKGKKFGIMTALAVGVVVLVGVLSFKNFHPYEHSVLR